ncbi:ribosome production factor 1-like [Oppia nitens]|uniref:ribosome production factor 1-like n=1 Tax=Oppia nitens TaxID=1686743 RepID=UPI0023DB71D3|nr:ribosome production factor 1-like [Oppia nitens]
MARKQRRQQQNVEENDSTEDGFDFEDMDNDDEEEVTQQSDDNYEDMNNSDGGDSDYEEPNDDTIGNDEDVDNNSKNEKSETNVLFPENDLLSKIKNKIRRREVYLKLKKEKKESKKEARTARQNEAKSMGEKAQKLVPRTIESTREPDETMVDPNDEDVKEDEEHDEMATYFRKEIEPKILITSSDNPHTKTIKFCRELKQTIPNAEFRFRNRSSIKNMVKAAIDRDYTDIVIVNEDWRKPNGLLHIHLPNGPTAHYKLSSIRYCKEIKKRAQYSSHRPEVILNNFNTRLGHSIGRMFASVFHYDPQFKGRRVVTFHNQRDYVFFRHHRYEFKNNSRAAIQEIGPRFTLKLRSLQKGTFDSKFGEYEWALKRHDSGVNRRRFAL